MHILTGSPDKGNCRPPLAGGPSQGGSDPTFEQWRSPQLGMGLETRTPTRCCPRGRPLSVAEKRREGLIEPVSRIEQESRSQFVQEPIDSVGERRAIVQGIDLRPQE